MKKLNVFILLFIISSINFAQIKVVTTTTVLADFVKEIGQEKVEVDYICRGDQDPHFIEILPSYMLKIRKADLFFKIGLSLEIWAQQLIDGSRNSSLKIIDVSKEIDKKDLPTGKIDASQGDIHPYGNPHYWLDPYNGKVIAKEVFDALAEFSPENLEFFKANYERYLNSLSEKLMEWQNKMGKAKNKPIIFFHSSWIYFADRFELNISGYVEPKPGVPPTPSHNAEIFRIIKENKIKTLVMENYYSDKAPNQIAEKTGIKIIKVPVGVYGLDGINTYIEMMDYIINNISKEIL